MICSRRTAPSVVEGWQIIIGIVQEDVMIRIIQRRRNDI